MIACAGTCSRHGFMMTGRNRALCKIVMQHNHTYRAHAEPRPAHMSRIADTMVQ
jgi:hypothetical protein